MGEKVLSKKTENVILSDGPGYSDRLCVIDRNEIPEDMHAVKVTPVKSTNKHQHIWMSIDYIDMIADRIENITQNMYDRPREDRRINGDFVFMKEPSHKLPCIICGDIIKEFLIGFQFSSIWFHHDCRHDFSDALRKVHDHSDWMAAERL